MAEQIVVEGGARLRRTLRKAGIDLATLKEANRAAAGIVASSAQANAPRGATGRLAGSVRAGATTRAGVVRAGKKSVPYAGPIHWGWPARNIAAQPWLSNAAQATEPAWSALYFDELEKIINTIEGA